MYIRAKSRNIRTGIPALTKCHFEIRISRQNFSNSDGDLGQVLRQIRIERCLSRQQVANDFGTTSSNIRNWEMSRRNVSLQFRTTVHDFIGICPCDVSLSLGLRLRERREYLGISIRRIAEIIQVDVHTISQWENEQQIPSAIKSERLHRFLFYPEKD